MHAKNEYISIFLSLLLHLSSPFSQAFDHNGDCYIDFDEIKKTMHFLGEAVSDEEVRAMIREADVDKDGRINFEGVCMFIKILR